MIHGRKAYTAGRLWSVVCSGRLQPRWVLYDAKRYGIELGEEVWKTLQERAYTSPIWYTP